MFATLWKLAPQVEVQPMLSGVPLCTLTIPESCHPPIVVFSALLLLFLKMGTEGPETKKQRDGLEAARLKQARA